MHIITGLYRKKGKIREKTTLFVQDKLKTKQNKKNNKQSNWK